MLRRVLSLVLVLGSFAAPMAFAQTFQTGNIVGKAVDSSGGRLPGVNVTLTSPVLITPRTTTTDGEGNYRFLSLAPGEYTVGFELSGFKKLSRSSIRVVVGATLTIDGAMEVGAVSEAVEVVGEAVAVDVTQTNVSTNLNSDALQKIPTARDVWAILQTMAPQVVLDREDVGGSEGGLQAVFSTHGSSWHQNTYAMNGADVTDPAATGATDFYFDYDSFEEAQISTAQHSAEVGTPGVYFNLIPKRGTDTFHGGLAYYFENSGTVSDNISDELRAKGITGGGGVNLFSDATAQLGGPLIKDKLRFFSSFRDWRIHRDVLNFPKSENTDLFSWLVNTSFQFDSKNRIDALVTRQTYLKPNRNAGGQVPPESTWVEDDVFRIYQGTYTSQITSNALLDARVAYVNIDFPLSVQPGVTKPNTTELSTGIQSGAASLDLDQFRSRFAAGANFSYFKNQLLGANHAFKVGYQFYRGFTEETDKAVDDVNLTLLNGESSTVLQYNTPVVVKNLFTGSVLFGQDSITKDKVTLNLGLRFEHTNGQLPAQSSPAGRFTGPRNFPQQDVISWNNLAPRLGLVYDVTGDHKTALKAGYGRYHHAISTGMINPPNQNGLGGRGFSWLDRNGDRLFQPGEEGDLLFAFGGSITSVDPNLERPRTDEFTLGFERELPYGIKLSVNGIYRKGKNFLAITEVGFPQTPASYIQTTGLDPGADGVSGSGDDQRVTIYNLRPELAGQNKLLVANPADFGSKYKGVEITLQRRFSNHWQGLLTYALSRADLSTAATAISQYGGEEEGAGGIGFSAGVTNPFQDINAKTNNLSGPSFYDRTHIIKLNGSYEIPKWGVTIAGVYKLQTGTPFGRLVTISQDVNGVALNQGPVTFFAESRDNRRFDTIHVLDLRLSKFFTFQQRHRVEAIVDFFNLFNVATVTNLNPNTGSQLSNPLAILGPRAIRFGARYQF